MDSVLIPFIFHNMNTRLLQTHHERISLNIPLYICKNNQRTVPMGPPPLGTLLISYPRKCMAEDGTRPFMRGGGGRGEEQISRLLCLNCSCLHFKDRVKAP
jgi:hypothetical protein